VKGQTHCRHGSMAVGLWSVGLWPWVSGVWVLGLLAWSVAMGLRCGSFLVVCLGLFGDLSLFCQNKLSDVSLCSWMLQNIPFADGPHGRGSQQIKLISTQIMYSDIH
jgi:hypothetical protein